MLYESKNLSWFAIVIYLCWFIWLVTPEEGQEHREQLKQFEEQIGDQYITANYLLRNTVDELQQWNFNQPLTSADEEYLYYLLRDISYKSDLLFSRYGYMVHPVHPVWQVRLEHIENYLITYVDKKILSEEQVADFYQALQANLYITMDFDGYIQSGQDFYNAMHDEQNEMVEVVKKRLATTY